MLIKPDTVAVDQSNCKTIQQFHFGVNLCGVSTNL